MFIPGVVCEASELILYCLGEGRLIYMRVLRLLARELAVEVRHVQDRFLKSE
jgi:hypothetical protein